MQPPERKMFRQYFGIDGIKRHFILENNGESAEPRELPPFGVPQGGAPSAIMWSMYINDLNDHLPDKCELLLFADDAALVVKGRCVGYTMESV